MGYEIKYEDKLSSERQEKVRPKEVRNKNKSSFVTEKPVPKPRKRKDQEESTAK